MKVKVLESFGGAEHSGTKGQIIDIPFDIAQGLMFHKMVEEVEDKEPMATATIPGKEGKGKKSK